MCIRPIVANAKETSTDPQISSVIVAKSPWPEGNSYIFFQLFQVPVLRSSSSNGISLSSALSRHSKACRHPRPPGEVKLHLLPDRAHTPSHRIFFWGFPLSRSEFQWQPLPSGCLQLSTFPRSTLLLRPTLFPVSFPADVPLAPVLPRSFLALCSTGKAHSSSQRQQENKQTKTQHPPLPVLPCRSPVLVTAAFEGQDFGECGHIRALEAVIYSENFCLKPRRRGGGAQLLTSPSYYHWEQA